MPQPRGRDLEDTARRLLAWFGRVLPAGSGFAIDGLGGPSATGFSSDTLLFDLSWRQDGALHKQPLVARIEPSGDYPVFPHYDVAQQFQVMRAVGEHGVPVPQMRWLETDEGVLGSRFYVMERVDGRVPTDTPPYHQAGWLYDLAPADRARLWWSGLDALCAVHRIDVSDPSLAFLPRAPAGRSPVQEQIDAYERFLDWGCDRSRLPHVVRALAWLRANLPSGEPLGLCWGDSRLANQIFQGLDCVAVIDWEMVYLGNPVADLAWWITMDRCFSEGIGVPRAEGFPSAAETVARWEERLGLEARHLAFYEVFAALRFSILMARIAGQMKHYGVLPPDHDMDASNLASVVLDALLQAADAG
jgi:aminoglycoside phosphotransferase (APT) family kinase protein